MTSSTTGVVPKPAMIETFLIDLFPFDDESRGSHSNIGKQGSIECIKSMRSCSLLILSREFRVRLDDRLEEENRFVPIETKCRVRPVAREVQIPEQ
jgi:hypothetical protein